MTDHKQQLIDAFSTEVARMLVEFEAFKHIDMDRRSTLAYARAGDKKGVMWNQWWQRDVQAAWDTIGPAWKAPNTVKLVHAAYDALCSPAASAKMGSQWSVPLRIVARDALLMSSTIVAYGDLQHPACQHAVARWKLWQEKRFVLGDQKNAFVTIPFEDAKKKS